MDIDRSINEMADIKSFIDRWDDQSHPDNRAQTELLHSDFGNINDNGQPGLYSSPELSPHQAQFLDSLEPGIRDLIVVLTADYGWVTYCSCEGHTYPGTEIEPAERHVGMIPRSDSEAATMSEVIEQRLAEVQENVGPVVADGPVEVGFGRDELRDVTGARVTTAEIWFSRRADASWEDYFSELDSVYRATVEVFQRQA